MIRSFDELVDFFSKDRFATTNGMYIQTVKEGDAKCAVDLDERHYNAVGGVQGGVIFTLADFAFAVAANCGEKTVVSIKSDISFVRSSRGKKLIAHAVEKSCGKKVAFYEIEIIDDLGELISLVSITGYVK